MVTGDLAATSVVDGLARNASAASLYSSRWKAEVGAEIYESVALQRFLFTDNRRIDALVTGAAAASPIVDSVTRWASGEQPYVALRRQIVLRNPSIGIVLGAMLLRTRLEATRGPLFQSEHL